MKNRLLISILTIIFISCSGGGSDDEFIMGVETTWELNSFNYTGAVSATSTSDDFQALVVSTSNETVNQSNGDYIGSAISFTYKLQGPGSYTIVNTSDFSSPDNDTNKVVSISCTVGTATTSGTRYDSTMSGSTINVSVDSSGRYQFSSSTAITLEKTVDVGGGVPNAPANASFRVDNAFDFSN